MRKVQMLVAVETVLLGALVALWSQRDDVEPVPGQPTSVVPRANDLSSAPSDGAAMSVSANGGVDVPVASEREAAPNLSADGSPVVVLYGRLVTSAPIARADVTRLSLRDGDAYRTAELGDDQTYAIAELHPGTWHVHCEVKGYRVLEFDHEIGTAPIQRLDVTLEPTLVLPVFIQTSAGKRLQAEMAKAEIWKRLDVVATAEPFAGDLAPIAGSSIGRFGVGRLRRSWDMNQLADENGDDGTLEIDTALPVYAAVILRHMVLARQRVDPGMKELRFTIDLEAVRERFATVRMRLVDERGGAVSGARLELNSAAGGARVSGGDGIVVVENVVPGYVVCDLWTKDRGRDSWQIAVSPGADLDLGDVVVGPSVQLRGRVVREDGAATTAVLQWTNLDRWRAPLPLSDLASMSADANGSFSLGVAAHRYLVTARAEDGRQGSGVFDARGAGVNDVRIIVRPTTAVSIVASGPVHITHTAVVYHPDGHPIAVCVITPRWRQGKIELPPGSYQLELYEGEGTLRRRGPLVVGDAPLTMEVGR